MTRVATLNLPSGNKGAKAKLYDNPRRTHTAVRWLNTHGVGLVGLQELATPSRIAFRAHPRWRVAAAPGNNIGLPILGTVGNAVAWRRDIWSKTGRRTTFRLTWGRRGLHIPSVILTHKATGTTVKVYAAHLPAGPEHADVREAMLDLIAADAEQYAGPVLMLCDTNDHRTRVLLMGRLEGWRVVGQGVDWICVLGPKVTGSDVHEGPRGWFTDHPIVTADIRL